MSASDFNKLLSERHRISSTMFRNEKLFSEYVRFHLPDTEIVGNKTDLFDKGFQLGAIYIVDDFGSGDGSGWWFVVGYHLEKERLEVFYGEYRNNRITDEGLYIYSLKKNTPYQKPNAFITDSSIIQWLMKYFVGENDDGEILIAYSPSTATKSTTLNFTKRGFLK